MTGEGDGLLLLERFTDGRFRTVVNREAEIKPSTWGILLVDAARTIAQSVAPDDPRAQAEFLVELKRYFELEWENDTDWPRPE